jgi:biotin operon repressor
VTINKGGRPKTIHTTPEAVAALRDRAISWPKVAKQLGISRSTAIKLYAEAKRK